MTWELYIQGRGYCGLLFGSKTLAARTARRVSNHKPWKIKSSDGRKVTGV